MEKNLISNEEIDKILLKEGVKKEDYIKAVVEGKILPLCYHPVHHKMMPFRVTKYYPNDNIEGYFVGEMH